MIDRLYFKSLLITVVVYMAIVGGLAAFVIFTGIAGFFLIVGVIVILVCYFYGCFGRNDLRKKGHRS